MNGPSQLVSQSSTELSLGRSLPDSGQTRHTVGFYQSVGYFMFVSRRDASERVLFRPINAINNKCEGRNGFSLSEWIT
jgi:hypothetical protein